MQITCEVCGNTREADSKVCPFCGHRQTRPETSKNKMFTQKTVNLEAGRPVTEVALNRMIGTIEDAVRNDISVITLIHGYGSSGKGGAIRLECRKMLDYMKSRGQIRDYIRGEEFSERSSKVKVLLQRYPQLRFDENLNKKNRGITQVILAGLVLFVHALAILQDCHAIMIS